MKKQPLQQKSWKLKLARGCGGFPLSHVMWGYIEEDSEKEREGSGFSFLVLRATVEVIL